MSCPTCDHTMQAVCNHMPPAFWCPRCGTLKMERYASGTTPLLVDRVRAFGDNSRPILQGERDLWLRLGVEESIRLPADRRKL